MSTPYGAIIGAVNQTAGGIANAVLGRQASSQSWDRQKKVYKRRTQWAVKDLKAAGLNPILAAGGTLGGGGVSTPMSAPTSLGQGQSLVEGFRLDLQKKQTNATVNLLEKDAEKSITQSAANSANAAAAMQKAETEKTQQVLNNMLALQAANNAENLGELRKGITAENKQKQAIAELYEKESTKGILQLKHFFNPFTGKMVPGR